MFRQMRKAKRETSKEQTLKYLKHASHGTLSTISADNGYPYGITVNHVVINDCIYFHCAKEGHKLDNIKKNNCVSFFAVYEATVDKKAYTTKYKSAHVFGKAYIVEDKREREAALYEIAKKFTGSFFAKAQSHILNAFDITAVVRIEIEHLTGKKR